MLMAEADQPLIVHNVNWLCSTNESFCGSTAESRNCFHIQVIRHILPLDPAIKSQDDRFHASQGPLCKRGQEACI